MKRTFSELIEAIPVHQERGPDNELMVVAQCPICRLELKGLVFGNLESATETLQKNVVTHVRHLHPES